MVLEGISYSVDLHVGSDNCGNEVYELGKSPNETGRRFVPEAWAAKADGKGLVDAIHMLRQRLNDETILIGVEKGKLDPQIIPLQLLLSRRTGMGDDTYTLLPPNKRAYQLGDNSLVWVGSLEQAIQNAQTQYQGRRLVVEVPPGVI